MPVVSLYEEIEFSIALQICIQGFLRALSISWSSSRRCSHSHIRPKWAAAAVAKKGDLLRAKCVYSYIYSASLPWSLNAICALVVTVLMELLLRLGACLVNSYIGIHVGG